MVPSGTMGTSRDTNDRYLEQHRFAAWWLCGFAVHSVAYPFHSFVLHGESNTSQASPRITIQRMCQPQVAVQPQQNQTKLELDTPAQKAKQSYQRSHPTLHEADAHTSNVHKNAPSRAQSPSG